MKRTTLITTVLISALSLNAFGFSSILQLGPVSAAPGETVGVKFDQLHKGISHTLSCHITNVTHPEQNMLVILKLGKIVLERGKKNSNTLLFINGQKQRFGFKYSLKSGSEIVLNSVSSMHEGLYLQNLDYSDTIQIHNCQAKVN